MNKKSFLFLLLFSVYASADDITRDSLPSVENSTISPSIKSKILTDIAEMKVSSRSATVAGFPAPTLASRNLRTDSDVERMMKSAVESKDYPKISLLKPVNVADTKFSACKLIAEMPSGRMVGGGVNGYMRLFDCPETGRVLLTEELQGKGSTVLFRELVNSEVRGRPARFSNAKDSVNTTQATIFWTEKDRTILLTGKKTDENSLSGLKAQAESISQALEK